jgi:hypothetical protein
VELLMPAKSKKQQRFMAAVANNPEFAKKVGVPQDVGEEFMKMKKGYRDGGALDMVKGPDGKMIPKFAMDGKGANDMGKSMPRMKSGGKVRGCGMATKGVRKAKMVSMKGS